jgi:phosphate transport system substrate-binding protein
MLAMATVAALSGQQLFAAEIIGAGASFPAPIYIKWADAFQKATGNRIVYKSIGSVGGIQQITAKTVSFGASDMPLKPDDLDVKGLIQFPSVIGGIVPVINLVDVKPGQLRLTGAALADIYLGKITKWNDKVITDLNPGVKLPDQDIAVVRRADGSGTSFIFTNYLSKVSREWKSKVGEGAVVRWPLGLTGIGNDGVSEFIKRWPGSIGYVEFIYAKQNKLKHVLMNNAAGNFVAPGDRSFKAAAASADWTKPDFFEILTNQPGKDAWPITGATYILMHKVADQPAQAAEVLKFFEWSQKDGAKMAEELDYVNLPESLVKLIRTSWEQIRDASGKAIFVGK